MNLDDIYTPIGVAREEIKRRWNDKELRKKIEGLLGKDLPDVFRKEPRAILFRAILTPNFENSYFSDLMDLIELKPICAELYVDKFCTMNKDKVRLGKMVFLHRSQKNKCDIITKRVVIDFDASEKKPFNEIKTLNNKDFVEFHHHLYKKQYKEIMEIFDASYLKKDGDSAKEVYERIFGICLINGVLFENFIAKDDEHEKKFSENVVLPAFKSVCDKFGLKPLIVPLLPLKNEEREEWDWYPGHLEKEMHDFFKENR